VAVDNLLRGGPGGGGREMKRFLPADEPQFLMELRIQPVAAQLASRRPPRPMDLQRQAHHQPRDAQCGGGWSGLRVLGRHAGSVFRGVAG
jgi:hypothetical protein